MNHLEQIKVMFVGQKSRTHDGKQYYRNVFLHEGKYHSVKDANDLSGKAGVVQFVKKGEDNGSGGKVVADSWSLLFASTAGTMATAKAAFDEL